MAPPTFMMIKKYNLLFFIYLLPLFCYSQNQNSIWVFGDSAGIDFANPNNPVPIISGMDCRGSCANISDSNGLLLFYAWDIANTIHNTGRIFNPQHQQMANGDSIVAEGWYQEFVIVPFPDSIGFYYLFSVGVTSGYHPGLYYSIVDMNANGGLGAVVSKNIQLTNHLAFDGISAVKHGNGRDWWLIFKPDGYNSPPNNDFYTYLISPSGISQPIVQSIGFVVSTNASQMNISKQGNRILLSDWKNLIEVIDFDRCSGVMSNAIVIEPEHQNESGWHVGNSFSPAGNLIYISHDLAGPGNEDSWLYQYNLNAANIAASRDTIYYTTAPAQTVTLRLAPDNKIYLSTGYYAYNYPFADSAYYPENMNLSVINQPDSLGALCDFQPYSFYLGGKRTYYGLPNNPNYELGPDSNSVCDTVLYLRNEVTIPASKLYVFYQLQWQKAFVNAQGLKGINYSLTIRDLGGRIIFKEQGKLPGPYFSRDLDCSSLSKGIYLISLQTEKEILTRKFAVE
jgi:hypothetical protein